MHVSTRFVNSGRSAYLAQFLQAMTRRPQFRLTYHPRRVDMCQRQNCRMATEYGAWTETWLEDGEPTEVSGTYFAIWRQHVTAWQIQREVFATTRCSGRRLYRVLTTWRVRANGQIDVAADDGMLRNAGVLRSCPRRILLGPPRLNAIR